MMASDLHELRSFFGGYFHEDWELDASEPDEVISEFMRSGTTSDKVDRIIAQIGHYVQSAKDEAAIERGLLEELGCYYLPSADGMKASDWLGHVADLLRKR